MTWRRWPAAVVLGAAALAVVAGTEDRTSTASPLPAAAGTRAAAAVAPATPTVAVPLGEGPAGAAAVAAVRTPFPDVERTTATTSVIALPPPTTAAPPTTAPPAPPPTAPPVPSTTAPLPQGGVVAAVGDSVMLGAAPRLAEIEGWTFEVDAAVSRQFTTGIALVAAAAASHPDRLVIALGTNGEVSDAELDQMMEATQGVPRVLLVTIQLPDRDRYAYEGPTNDVLRRGAERWRAGVIDWNAVSTEHPEALARDGYHLTPAGARLYAQMVTAAL